MEILKNNARQILLEDWIPPKIVNREEQVEKIKKHIIEYLTEKEQMPPSMYIYGGSGSGKTVTITKKLKENYDLVKKHIPNFKLVFLNTRKDSIPSTHAFLVRLAFELREYLPIYSNYFEKTISRIPKRGWRSDEYLRIIKEIIHEKKVALLVLLDEIDKIKDYSFLLDTCVEQYKDFKERFYGISFVFISNDPTLLDKIGKSTRDRIPIINHFTPYGTSELYQILELHAQETLTNYSEDVLIHIASKISETSSSAREAKKVLYFLASLSKGRLDTSRLEMAFGEMRKDILSKEIRDRPFLQKLILLSVIKRHKNIKKMSKLKKKGLYKYFMDPTIGSMYDIYKKMCPKFNTKPVSYRYFFEIVENLSNSGLLKTNTTSLGRARGVTTLVYPPTPLEVIEPILKRALSEEYSF